MKSLKFKTGSTSINVLVEFIDDRIWLSFPFNMRLKDEVKLMQGARWDPTTKRWHIKNSSRNLFALQYLCGIDVYARYDRPLVTYTSSRTPYAHQYEMSCHVLTRHYCGLACEMGTGKTLALIEAIEQSGVTDVWWLAPKSGMVAVMAELRKWNCKIAPRLISYDGLKKILADWQSGKKPPQMVIADESHMIKTITSQRTEAAFHIAEAVRKEWGDEGYCIFMSGSPAPKSPLDWYSQCEFAQPGYIKEGDHFKFMRRLAIVKDTATLSGAKYPKLCGWRDSDLKCKECGDTYEMHTALDHMFVKGTNEIAYLYERMKGLVLVKFKKDCLDLPEKIYTPMVLKPSRDLINAAKIVAAKAENAIKTLTLLRELSDGFLYETKVVEEKNCNCDNVEIQIDEEGNEILTVCPTCHGSGKIKKFETTINTVETPKDEALLEILESKEDLGRLVVYAGFTASIDKITLLVKKAGWDYIRVDGRGWDTSLLIDDSVSMLEAFQNNVKTNDPDVPDKKIVFIGHPGSAGMGLTLTAADTIVYYSNDFNGQNRIQSEDRIHRPGSIGCNIVDLINLPTDFLVLENLQAKRDLQAISLGDMSNVLKAIDV